MNEIEYRNRLIENIETINELILKVDRKNKTFYIILMVCVIIILILLLIVFFYAINRKKDNKEKDHLLFV